MLFNWLKRKDKPDLAAAIAKARRAPMKMDSETRAIVDQFHALYYDSRETTWDDTHWMGTKALKCPFDMWLYQEIVHETQPDLIIETGTWYGGSGLYLATLCDLARKGQVVSIDIDHSKTLPEHPRLRYITGSSVSQSVLTQVARLAKGKSSVLVILDSDHSRAHVAQELAAYQAFVTVGNYLIVEDTNINGHPVLPAYGEGPMEAVLDFMRANDHFMTDVSKEKFLMSFNPKGYLLKTKETPTPIGR
jgi:cephalosporin hydroxylase